MTILVTGARGHVARSLIQQLLEAGEQVRAASKDPAAAHLPTAVDVVAADDPALALDGVDRVFLYADPQGLDAFLAQAREAGVRHVVLLSAALADPTATDAIARLHGVAEESVTASGLPWTALRPGAFATNTLQWAPEIRTEGRVTNPFPDTHSAPIHEADIAEIALNALIEDGHENAVYELTGPDSITQRDQLNTIARTIARPLEWHLQDLETHRQVLSRWGSPEIVESLLKHSVAATNIPVTTTNTFAKITGKHPRSFAQWAEDHKEAFTGTN
ncbi:SDR family oxidoreductase [Nonomuraea guangzhouensis]|uniref:SDR family oxidoreductase n=1 Tax=Nonomuraea guangzhouensis TaxID=1291555 RepID=A0ABW4GHS7_9ACTN|nr:NAD(P)H-binding protein [Nonomuraea guangzhouensis]